jgi:hypothetical protein
VKRVDDVGNLLLMASLEQKNQEKDREIQSNDSLYAMNEESEKILQQALELSLP